MPSVPAQVRLANAPVSWGVDYADDSANPPFAKVFDDIAAAGYRCCELGPLGYLPGNRIGEELASRGLSLCGGFLFEPFSDPLRLKEILAKTHTLSRVLSEAGATQLVLVHHLDPERTLTAGRSGAARRQTRVERERLVRALTLIAEIAAVAGVRAVVHPHAATPIEFEDEIERLLEHLDPDLIGLCIDTGHSAFADVDPVALYERHAARVSHLHLKDVDEHALAAARTMRLDFLAAVSAGVFCPLGSGRVDFQAFRATLAAHGFDGCATVEQDRDPSTDSSPLEDARASLDYLTQIGFATTHAPV